MPNYRYDHIHLVTPDALKTAQFYENMFQARRVSTRQLTEGRTSAELDLSGSRILIIGRPRQKEPAPSSVPAEYGLDHFGIRTDDMEAAVAELKAKGAKFRDEIRVIPGAKIAFMWGPENVLIELLEITG